MHPCKGGLGRLSWGGGTCALGAPVGGGNLAEAAGKNWWVLLPTLITMGTAMFGFGALCVLLTGPLDPYHTSAAAWLIFAACLCDATDGLAARATKSATPFGAQLDSLSDAVAFGVAPAALVVVLASAPKPFAIAAGGLLLAGALARLARFNVEHVEEPGGHLYFKGLPSPAAGVIVATLTLLHGWLGEGHWVLGLMPAGSAAQVAEWLRLALAPLAVLLAALMVSRFRYADLPKHYLRKLKPRWHLVLFLGLAIWVSPEPVMTALFVGYALSTPVVELAKRAAFGPAMAQG